MKEKEKVIGWQVNQETLVVEYFLQQCFTTIVCLKLLQSVTPNFSSKLYLKYFNEKRHFSQKQAQFSKNSHLWTFKNFFINQIVNCWLAPCLFWLNEHQLICIIFLQWNNIKLRFVFWFHLRKSSKSPFSNSLQS